MTTDSVKRICVIRGAGGLGDAVTIQAAIAGLHEKYPEAEIDWILPREISPLFADDPNVTRFIAPPAGVDNTLFPYARPDVTRFGLRNEDYDLIVDAWCPCHRHEVKRNYDVRESRIESFCAEAGVAPRTPRLYITAKGREWADMVVGGADRPLFVLGWHSARSEKDWPDDAWWIVADRIAGLGATVVFVGRKPFGRARGNVISVMNASLQGLAALCERADAAVGLDSATMHIASALGTRSLWLFGPTNPISTLRYYPSATAIWVPDVVGCDCPCYYNAVRGWHCSGRVGDCMLAIRPEVVLRTAERMVDWTAAEHANAVDRGGQKLYRYYCRLGMDLKAYGAWHGAYAEFIDQAVGIRGKRMLDVGSACGSQLKGFLARGADAWGVEPDGWMAHHAVEGVQERLRAGKVEDVVAAGPFAVLHSSQVCEHVPEQEVPAHLAAAYEALDKGGVFYVSLCLSTTPGATCDETHITLRPREWWAARFAEAGFEDATEAYRSAVDALPMQRERKWDWFILRKP